MMPIISSPHLKGLVLFSALLFSSQAQAQVPSLSWQRPIGSTGDDFGYSIKPTTDSGFILSGGCFYYDGDAHGYHGYGDMLVAKLTATGSISWSKAFGGSGTEQAFGVIQTSDGGYAAAGGSNSADGDFKVNRGGYDVAVIKLSATGIIQWSKTYGGSNEDYAYNIIQTKDGGYLVTGFTLSTDGDVTHNSGKSDVWLLKLNDTGAIEWQKTYGGTADEYGTNSVQCANGGYIIGGTTASTDGDVTTNHGVNDFWAIRINDTGAIMWQKTYGGSDDDEVTQILQTPDKGYIMSGYATSYDGDVTGFYGGYGDFWVVKTDSVGSIQWEKTYGGSSYDIANSICVAKDSGYIVAGFTASSDQDVTDLTGEDDEWVIKIGNDGTLLWQKTLGGDSSAAALNVCPALKSGYATVGNTTSDNHDVSGKHGGNDGIADIWAVKLDETPTAVTNLNKENPVIKVYPTVTRGDVFISLPPGYEQATLMLTNISGQQFSLPASTGSERRLSLKNMPPGNYVISIRNVNSLQSYNIIKL